MEKMPAVFVGHGDPMIALKRNEITETAEELIVLLFFFAVYLPFYS